METKKNNCWVCQHGGLMSTVDLEPGSIVEVCRDHIGVRPENARRVEDIKFPERLSVFEDKKTKAKTVAFPFQFPDGENGVLMVCKVVKQAWFPTKEISNVTITFNEK